MASIPTTTDGTPDRVLVFTELTERDVERLMSLGNRQSIPSGQAVCEQGEQGRSMFIILRGRFKVSIHRDAGDTELLSYLGPGEHFGELSMLLKEPRTATVRAVTDAEVLELDDVVFDKVIELIPKFFASLSRTLGTWLRRAVVGKKQRPYPKIVAFVHSSPIGVALAQDVVETLLSEGELVQVFTSKTSEWPKREACEVRPLGVGEHDADRSSVTEALSRASGLPIRTIIELDQAKVSSDIIRQCELVWWLINADDPRDSMQRLDAFKQQERNLAERIQVVSLLPSEQFSSVIERSLSEETVASHLRIAYRSGAGSKGRFRAQDIARLVHQLQGVHLGIAFGGGGARGLAHLGVLRAFEEEGLYFDRFAGTSAGAFITCMYAAGFVPDDILEIVAKMLTPPRLFYPIPKSKKWYLLGLFRLDLVSRKLHRHVRECKFEQLFVPSHTVSVDLISGDRVIRENGEIGAAILESLNLPGISPPIARNGQILVDGGVLENVPSSVLRKNGCNFVVAIDVSSRLSESFHGNTIKTPANKMKRPGTFRTLMRVVDVQNARLLSIGSSAADILIEPDTSPFAFEDFSQGPGLAEAGYVAAKKAIPHLKQLIDGQKRSPVKDNAT